MLALCGGGLGTRASLGVRTSFRCAASHVPGAAHWRRLPVIRSALPSSGPMFAPRSFLAPTQQVRPAALLPANHDAAL